MLGSGSFVCDHGEEVGEEASCGDLDVGGGSEAVH